MLGEALDRSAWLSRRLVEAGQLARGMAVARAGYREAFAAGLPAAAAIVPGSWSSVLTWDGRLDAAEKLLMELELWVCPRLSGARVRSSHWPGATSRQRRSVTPKTTVDDATRPARTLSGMTSSAGSGSMAEEHASESVALAEAYLGVLGECDYPTIAAPAARIGFQALTSQRRLQVNRTRSPQPTERPRTRAAGTGTRRPLRASGGDALRAPARARARPTPPGSPTGLRSTSSAEAASLAEPFGRLLRARAAAGAGPGAADARWSGRGP